MISVISRIVKHITSSWIKEPPTTTSIASPIALGRWGIQYEAHIIDRKISQANEDHCGCCIVVGDITIDQKHPKPETKRGSGSNNSVVRYEKREAYLLPYVL